MQRQENGSNLDTPLTDILALLVVRKLGSAHSQRIGTETHSNAPTTKQHAHPSVSFPPLQGISSKPPALANPLSPPKPKIPEISERWNPRAAISLLSGAVRETEPRTLMTQKKRSAALLLTFPAKLDSRSPNQCYCSQIPMWPCRIYPRIWRYPQFFSHLFGDQALVVGPSLPRDKIDKNKPIDRDRDALIEGKIETWAGVPI